MKKIIFASSIALIISCSEKAKENSQNENSNTTLPSQSSDIATNNNTPKNDGLALIERADCLSCHKVDTKLVGPSFQEIANKYSEADMELLASKIIEGGSGVWGNVPMSPHTNVSKEDAHEMVKYILKQKK